ncbi:galactose-1-phosphate uridylyltransferase [Nautilia sp.]
MSEIRRDFLRNDYVLIAPERLHRPVETEYETKKKSIKRCPFCPGNEKLAAKEIYSLKIGGEWKTRVVPNLYKAVMIEADLKSLKDGVNEKWEGFGAHEIIIDTRRHIRSYEMEKDEIFYWLETVNERVCDLKNDKRLVYANVFKNDGGNAGASQGHPHTQIIALPLMSFEQRRYFGFLYEYYLKHGRSALDDLYESEKNSPRFIKESEHFLVFAPYASEYAFETAILSKTTDMTETEELSGLIYEIYAGLKKELGTFDFNVLFYFAPLNRNFENEAYFDDVKFFFRFFIRIVPRIYKLGGFEVSSGIKINPLLPEIVAKLLKGKTDGN